MFTDKQQLLYKLAEIYNIRVDQSGTSDTYIVTELLKIIVSGSTHSTDWCNYWVLSNRLYIHLIQDFNQTNNGTLLMYDSINTDTSSTLVTI